MHPDLFYIDYFHFMEKLNGIDHEYSWLDKHPDVYRLWLRGNEWIKKVGITHFYEEVKDKSHYIGCIRDDS